MDSPTTQGRPTLETKAQLEEARRRVVMMTPTELFQHRAAHSTSMCRHSSRVPPWRGTSQSQLFGPWLFQAALPSRPNRSAACTGPRCGYLSFILPFTSGFTPISSSNFLKRHKTCHRLPLSFAGAVVHTREPPTQGQQDPALPPRARFTFCS